MKIKGVVLLFALLVLVVPSMSALADNATVQSLSQALNSSDGFQNNEEDSEATLPRPNVVLLVIDDISYWGDDFFSHLPNFKEIFLDHGMSFREAYGNDPLCCPGRANILTGQWAHRNGVTVNDARLFDPRESIATELHDLGYRTGIFGKYFNLTNRLADKTPQGWDFVAIQSGGYYNTMTWVQGVEHRLGNDAVKDYSTDYYAKLALDFVENAPSTDPLFLYLSPYATHFGADENGKKDHLLPVPAPRHRSDPRCSDVDPYKPANYKEANVSDKPAWVRRLRQLGSFYNGGYPLVKACRALLSVDEQIGAIADELKTQGRFDNTLWIAIGDNGWGGGSHNWLKKSAPYTAQIPLYVSWPDGFGTSPAQSDLLVSNVDLAPTICEVAGCVMGPYPNGKPVNGQSFAGLIAPWFSSSMPSRKSILMEHRGTATIPRWKSIQTNSSHSLGLWHYIEYPGTGERELYDVSGGPCLFWHQGMSGDPCELRNLAYKRAYRSIWKQLAKELHEMW